jgi:hypothetical protein
MKKIYFVCFLIISILIILSIKLSKQKYNESYLDLKEKLKSDVYYNVFDYQFLRYGEYPESTEKVINSFIEEGFQNEILYYFGDPFGKKDNYIEYIPLYNRKTIKREGYILLSAGIDGRINNVFKDSIFLDEDIQLRLYDKSDTTFFITKRWFGNKDWLISKVDGRQLLRDQAMPTEIQSLAKQARSLIINDTWMILTIKDRIVKLDTVVYFCYQDVWIKNYPLEYDLIRPYQIGDSISIAGVFRGWENDSTIKMINCIPVGDN